MTQIDNLNLEKITQQLLDTFIEAGNAAKKISKKGVKITIKPDSTPVTDGDMVVNNLLTDKIRALTPEIPIISEETVNLDKKNNNKTFWLIDPIDGTKEYIKKKSEYTLNAALIIDLKPAIGIVFAPEKNRLFFSHGKNQAFEINNGQKIILNCKKKNTNEIIALVNSDKTPSEILDFHKIHKVTKTIKMSSSFKFCTLAAGEADIYVAKARAFEWDIAAGHAILIHSGGTITDHEEKNFLYGKENYKNTPIIAKRAENLEM